MKHELHPVLGRLLGREHKETLLHQRPLALWFTGLSGSGKTTLALRIERELHERGHLCQVLDGDNIRTGINGDLGFTTEDREENIRRVAEVSKLFLDCGVITLNCFISPMADMRQLARSIISAPDFIEVFVDAPLAVCEARDVKGLYKKARAGLIPDFTGVSAPYEAPGDPDIHLETSGRSIDECAEEILAVLLPRISTDPR